MKAFQVARADKPECPFLEGGRVKRGCLGERGAEGGIKNEKN